jgi:hypothetical protein
MVEQQCTAAERTAGRIDADRYQAALRELMLHQKAWWMVGADSGQWYVREGDQWVARLRR